MSTLSLDRLRCRDIRQPTLSQTITDMRVSTQIVLMFYSYLQLYRYYRQLASQLFSYRIRCTYAIQPLLLHGKSQYTMSVPIHHCHELPFTTTLGRADMLINSSLLNITTALSGFLHRRACAFDGPPGQNEAIATLATEIGVYYPTHGLFYFLDMKINFTLIIFDFLLLRENEKKIEKLILAFYTLILTRMNHS